MKLRPFFSIVDLAERWRCSRGTELLGDTVATVEKHYAPFVKELRDRTRRIMDAGESLEKVHCTNFARAEASKIGFNDLKRVSGG